MALALNKPVLGIHHLEGHLLSPLLADDANIQFPFVALLVSGGHTQLMKVTGVGEYTILGETLDDAAGEAFDKTAKILGLPYPGGPLIDQFAKEGNPKAFPFTKPKVDGLNFSFSGLKTQILYFVQKNVAINPNFIEENKADICASVQNIIIKILMDKLKLAVEETGINQIAIGEYEWLRISLAYQNGDVKIRVDTTINSVSINQDLNATLASFIGFNTYIKNFTVKNQSITVNGNRSQGFWGFDTAVPVLGTNIPIAESGQAPAGATTVVNPLFNTSPIPAGSCVVTAAFANGKLKITGNETKDIIVECSFSINNSVEWRDLNPNGKWEPLKGETLVDMGIRGLMPTIK